MFIELRNNKKLLEDGSDSEMQEDIKTIEYDSTQSTLDYTAMENEEFRTYGKYKVRSRFVGDRSLTEEILDYAHRVTSMKYEI